MRATACLVGGESLGHCRRNSGIGRAILQQHRGGAHHGARRLQVGNAISNNKLEMMCEKRGQVRS